VLFLTSVVANMDASGGRVQEMVRAMESKTAIDLPYPGGHIASCGSSGNGVSNSNSNSSSSCGGGGGGGGGGGKRKAKKKTSSSSSSSSSSSPPPTTTTGKDAREKTHHAGEEEQLDLKPSSSDFAPASAARNAPTTNAPTTTMTSLNEESLELIEEPIDLYRFTSIDEALEINGKNQELQRLISDFMQLERDNSVNSTYSSNSSSSSSSSNAHHLTDMDMCEVCIIDFPSNQLYGAALPCDKKCDCSIKMCLRW
jgi:hypothetical protein